LSFVPTAKEPNHFELLRDLDTFFHKIRRLSHCKQQCTVLPKFPRHKLRKKKFDYNRAFNSFADLEGVLGIIKQEVSELSLTDHIKGNLTYKERQALNELKNNTDIIINKSDKSTNVVIQDRSTYIQEGLDHLNDCETYLKLDGNPTNSICKGINSILNDYHKKGLLTKQMLEACSPAENARLARLYFLKKTHKIPMGIRPIVSCCDSPTENLSQFIDYWLQPIMKALPSYLKNSTQLVNELKQLKVKPNIILVTIDVKSLYTCIPHEDGIKACSEALIELKKSNPSLPDPEMLVNLLEIVLTMNTFEFNNACYQQLQGSAMGSILSPAYANIFMGKLENEFLSQTTLKPLYYKRYIDDLIVLWEHTEDELKNFISNLNSFHPTIKFTFEYSHHSINYLDLLIHKGPDFLLTKILDVSTYIKPTNKQAYIHETSFHPPGTSKGIIIGEMKRFVRTNSRFDKFLELKERHTINLLKRGYSNKFIRSQMNKVKFSNRSQELKPRQKGGISKRLAFITRFSRVAPKVMGILKKHWPEIQQSKCFKHNSVPLPFLTFRKNRNLRSYLVRSRLNKDCTESSPPSIKMEIK